MSAPTFVHVPRKVATGLSSSAFVDTRLCIDHVIEYRGHVSKSDLGERHTTYARIRGVDGMVEFGIPVEDFDLLLDRARAASVSAAGQPT